VPDPIPDLTTLQTRLADGSKEPRTVPAVDPEAAARPPTLADMLFSPAPHASPHGVDALSPEVRLTYNRQAEALLGPRPDRLLPRVRSSGDFQLVLPDVAVRLDEQVVARKAQVEGLRERIAQSPQAGAIQSMLQTSRLLCMPQSFDFAQRVAARLGMEISPMRNIGFASRDARHDLPDVRGYNVTLITGAWDQPDHAFHETCRVIDVLKRSGASSVAVMFTYMSSRQDRTDSGRTHVDTALQARFLEIAGADQVLALEPHNRYLETAYRDAVFTPLRASTILLKAIDDLLPRAPDLRNKVVYCSPDFGGVATATFYAASSPNDLLIVKKQRDPISGKLKVKFMSAVPQGSTVVIVDDMIDTGGTIIESAQEAKQRGAARVVVLSPHPVFSRQAWQRLQESPAVDLIVTGNTAEINIPLWKSNSPFKVLMADLSPIVAETMLRYAISNDPGHPARRDGKGSVRALGHEMSLEPTDWVGHEAPVIAPEWWVSNP